MRYVPWNASTDGYEREVVGGGSSLAKAPKMDALGVLVGWRAPVATSTRAFFLLQLQAWMSSMDLG